MSLTNPNKIVTEERLSEFYGQILPYMGGMPEMVANKFSKGDIISTTETLVGSYNGKPMYQKLIIDTVPSAGNSKDIAIGASIDWATAKIMAISSLDGGSIQDFNAIKTTTKSINWNFRYTIQPNGNATKPNTITIFNDSNSNYTDVNIIVRYTKTTDSPIAIGDANDYSTTEKIVGTWIDGKPIWQNTVSTGGNVPSGATLILRTAMASTGYDTILYTKTS